MSLWKILNARWGSGAAEIDEVRLDAMTNVLPAISYPHYAVHEGRSFISDYVDETMNDNDTLALVFKTPTGTKRVHLIAEFTTLVGGDLRIWEGVTWNTNTGTFIPILNRKREAVMDSSILLEDKTATPAWSATDQILLNPTNLATGGATSIHHFYAWGKKEKIQAGGARDIFEFIFEAEYSVCHCIHSRRRQQQGASNFELV